MSQEGHVEGVEDVKEGLEEEYSTRKKLVALYEASDRTASPELLSEVAGAERSYASQIISDIDRGEIDEDYIDGLDDALINWAEYRIHNAMAGETPEDVLRKAPAAQIAAAAAYIHTGGLSMKDLHERVVERFSEEGGYENSRKAMRRVLDREVDPDEYLDPRVRDAVREKMEEMGIAVRSEGGASKPIGGGISGGEVESMDEVLARLELLREQAEYEDDRGAEFVAMKAIEWINDAR